MKKSISLIDVLIVVLILLAIYLIMTRILGHSATDIQIFITFFLLLTSLIYKLTSSIYSLNREFGEFKIKTMNSFKIMKEDIGGLRNELKIKK